jgi:soluble lytic murein transglycosylase
VSARPATRPVVTRAAPPAAARRRRRRRRRVASLLGFAVLVALLAAVVVPRLPVAAVIYAESKFRDQTSHAGARGLMQITPATARYIARLSGGTTFEQGDLATPQVNISYGVYYLRYLLRRYGENKVLALAAYNGGEGNVDRWIVDASMSERSFGLDEIPFTETREYVGRVLDVQRDYRRKYRRELGL